jgi:sugar O-acyltransferase (sialic acid O-acetyltransferase NeuD family)
VKKKLVIFGAQRYAEICHHYFEKDADYEVVAFSVDGEYAKEPTFRGLPLVPFEELDRRFPPDDHALFVAVGHRGVNTERSSAVAAAEARGYTLASHVSPRAQVGPDLVVQPNTMIMEGAFVQPFVEIGRDCVIWSTTRVGFHTRIGDHCWIVCALFGESVTVGDHSFIGLNATLAPSITIGRSNVIGAGALVMHDTEDFAVYKGHASTPSEKRSDQLRRF